VSEFERRKIERFTFGLPARLSAGPRDSAKTFELKTRDISAGGAFLYTRTPLPIGSKVSVEIVLPLDQLKTLVGKRSSVSVMGQVVRKDDQGMAVRFEESYRISPL